MQNPSLVLAPLGQDVSYPDAYDPKLLFPIDRATNRQTLQIPGPCFGADIWNEYEVSWLKLKGKPLVALARFVVPQESPRLIESKSFKLYLNSFNEERFDSFQAVREIMGCDLSQAAGAPIEVQLNELSPTDRLSCQPLEGASIDDADIEITHYSPQPGLLRCIPNGGIISETLVSDLLKSNCPVTGQPDWGSVQVRYTGQRLDRDALLAYIVSLRRHTEFHEHCVEKMYCDIWQACKPQSLMVYARYTRRGGLDINPWRSSEPLQVGQERTPRQ
ncbi:MAG TPA: NADPH-dependent 7-cyano-7-deazaguanine reductase QueF [Pusillimonas sp.]